MRLKKGLYILFLVTLFCLVGCGRHEEEKRLQSRRLETANEDFLYVSAAVSDMSWDSADRLFTCMGDKSYYVRECFFLDGEPVTEEQLEDIADGMEGITVVSEILRQSLAGDQWRQPERLCEVNAYISAMSADAQGNVYVVSQTMESFWGDQGGVCLEKYDSGGAKIYQREIDLTSGCGGIAADGKGNAAVLSGRDLLCFDRNGKESGRLESNGFILDVRGDWEEGVYALCLENGENCLKILDAGEGQKKALIFGLDGTVSGLKEGKQGSVLLESQDYVYRYSTETGEYEKLFSWTDANVYREDILTWWQDREDNIRVVFRNAEERKLMTIRRKSAADAMEKEIVTIGVYGAGSELRSAVVKFNRESSKYHIRIKDYREEAPGGSEETARSEAALRLSLDLRSGSAPDILDASWTDLEALVRKREVEDLASYLQKSKVLSQEDFWEAIIEDSTYEGVLASLAKYFTVKTLVGKTSVVGEESGWNCGEWMEMCNRYPDAELISWMDPGFSQYSFEVLGESQAVEMALVLNADSFVDPKTGKCTFSSGDFKSILQLASRYHRDMLYGYIDDDYVYKHKNDLLLLEAADIRDYYSLNICRSHFGGEPVNCIGYPTGKKGYGNLLMKTQEYCILAASGHKEAAWDFLEFYLTDDERKASDGFSTQKKVFEKDRRAALKQIEDYEKKPEAYADNEIRITREDVDLVDRLMEKCVGTRQMMDRNILTVIGEEEAAFFTDQRSLDDTAEMIQNRVQLYVDENR